MPAEREAAAGFDATLNATLAFPRPLAGDDSDTQGLVIATDQEQSRVVETETVPEPPPGGNDEGDEDTLTEHLSPDGPTTVVEEDPQAPRQIVRRKRRRAGPAVLHLLAMQERWPGRKTEDRRQKAEGRRQKEESAGWSRVWLRVSARRGMLQEPATTVAHPVQ